MKYQKIIYICNNTEVTIHTDMDIKNFKCPVCGLELGLKRGCQSYNEKYKE